MDEGGAAQQHGGQTAPAGRREAGPTSVAKSIVRGRGSRDGAFYGIPGCAAWVAEMNNSAAVAAVDETDLVRRLKVRDADAFRLVMQTYNQRLYRVARAILRNDAEAEDVVQEAYVRAFAHLDDFRGESTLSTWLSRIVANEALDRLRARRRSAEALRELADSTTEAHIMHFPLNALDPERAMAQREILHLVELATDSLPDDFRAVFVARVIDGMSGQETAVALGVRLETVNTRLHRARVLLRRRLEDEIGPLLLDAFPFAGRRCERLIQAVMRRLGFSD